MLRLAAVTASVVVALTMLATGASAATIPGHYIVVLKDSVQDPGGVAAEHARKFAVERSLLYRHALKGYAAAMSESAVEKVRSDPRVLMVSSETELRSAAAPQPCVDPSSCQALGNGVNRIDGDLSSTSSGDGQGSVPVNVAVLDGGIQVDHPDLNVVGGKDCSGGNGFDDRDGHGTLVAGFIGALDNSIGRVGVAPGARLWAVRVLDAKGSGNSSQVICGLDFVAGTRTDADPTNDIAVANLSLGTCGQKDTTKCKAYDDGNCGLSNHLAEHVAICNTAASGVVLVAAAGNESTDLALSAPATYDEVLTATAIADKDGAPGGLGGQLSCLPSETDDTAATFSNYATQPQDAAHAVAAPGVCINSTYIGSSYATSSGTSFAAPLVSGTVALCIYSGPCKGLTPSQIIQKIVTDARTYNESRKGSGYGFLGDPLRPIAGKYYGYLIRAGLY